MSVVHSNVGLTYLTELAVRVLKTSF